jgi:hypothetical protein
MVTRIRTVREEDINDLAEANKSLDSYHAPTDLAVLGRLIQRSIISSTGQSESPHIHFVAETLEAENQPRIVGGGGLVKMTTSQPKSPFHWRTKEDGSLILLPYEDPTLEFGGASVAEEFKGRKIGLALTYTRAYVVSKIAAHFGVEFVLADFMPKLDDDYTKENVFWSDLIVPALQKHRTLKEIISFVETRTGREIRFIQDLSMLIGNILPDDDRNEMIDKYFPKSLDANLMTPEIWDITQTVGGKTQAAVKNMKRVYGANLEMIGAFPINGGPNYRAPVNGITSPNVAKCTFLPNPKGQTVLVLSSQFTGIHHLASFKAYLCTAEIDSSGAVVLPASLASLVNTDQDSTINYYTI